MDALSGVGAYWGFGGAESAPGKLRFLTYFAFLTFALFAASLADGQSWVVGYLEYLQAPNPMPGVGEPFASDAASATGAALGADALAAQPPSMRRLLQQVTVQPEVHLSLTFEWRIQNGLAQYNRGTQIWTLTYMAINDYLADINWATTNEPRSRFYGLAKFDPAVFASTKGLLGTAAFLQCLVWIVLMLVGADAGGIAGHKATRTTLFAAAVGACFFSAVAMILFSASGVKEEICKAYDPDAGLAGKGCVYGDGFGCAVACSISAAVQALLLRFWLPADGAVPAAKYAFGSGATAAATGLKAGEYQVVESQGLGAAPGSYNSTSL